MAQKLGQHFLTDQKVISDIITAAELTPSDTVLEIGPGKGILTKALAATGARIIAVEKDGELHHKLKKQFNTPNKGGAKVELIHGDIRNFNINSLPAGYKLVANIPYYLTGQLIQTFLTAPQPPSISVLMLQKEVVDRLTATKGEGSLLQLTTLMFAEPKRIGDVPKEKFAPPPKVDSAIVALKLRTKPFLPAADHRPFFRLLKFAFAGKRKKLTNTLPAALKIPKEEILTAISGCNLPENARPQELDINEWICLYKDLLSRGIL